MNSNYYFISDIHLGFSDKTAEEAKERLLVKLLCYAGENAKELFIVGDLFDYWFEYKRVYQKGYFRTLTALQDLTESGIKVHYFIGNHDFLHRNFFKDEIGVQLYHEPAAFILNGKKFFIGHGDGLVENDYGYLILKKILRNRVLQRFYSMIHPDIGVSVASSTSRKSRDYTTKKDFGKPDGLFEAAKKKIETGYDYVLFGHLHKRIMEQYKDGYYINLGSWLDKPCYGVLNEQKFEIIDWK